MANVLPEPMLKKIRDGYHGRALIMFSSLFLVAELLAAVPMFVASYNASVATTDAAGNLSAEDSILERQVKIERVLLHELRGAMGTSTASTGIRTALSLRPQGITIDQVTFSNDARGVIALSGTAPDRDTLNGYRTTLLSRKDVFSAVELPVQALVSAEGGRFTLTLLGNF